MTSTHLSTLGVYLMRDANSEPTWAKPNPLKATVTVRQDLHHRPNIFIAGTKFRHSQHAKAQWVLMTQLNEATVTLSVGFHTLPHLNNRCTGLRIGATPLIRLSCYLQSVTRLPFRHCKNFSGIRKSHLISEFFFSQTLNLGNSNTFQQQPPLTKLDRSLKWKLLLTKPVFWFLSKICEVRMTGH